MGDPRGSNGPGTIRHPLRRFFQARASHSAASSVFSGCQCFLCGLEKPLGGNIPCPGSFCQDFQRSAARFQSALPKVFSQLTIPALPGMKMTLQTSPADFHNIKRPRIIFRRIVCAQNIKGPDVLLKAVRLLVPKSMHARSSSSVTEGGKANVSFAADGDAIRACPESSGFVPAEAAIGQSGSGTIRSSHAFCHAITGRGLTASSD